MFRCFGDEFPYQWNCLTEDQCNQPTFPNSAFWPPEFKTKNQFRSQEKFLSENIKHSTGFKTTMSMFDEHKKSVSGTIKFDNEGCTRNKNLIESSPTMHFSSPDLKLKMQYQKLQKEKFEQQVQVQNEALVHQQQTFALRQQINPPSVCYPIPSNLYYHEWHKNNSLNPNMYQYQSKSSISTFDDFGVSDQPQNHIIIQQNHPGTVVNQACQTQFLDTASACNSYTSKQKEVKVKSPIVKRNMNANTVIEGWLYKQGSEGLKVWRKRWFVLSEYCLYYYKNQDESKLLGSILLPSYCISKCTESFKKYCFKCEHANMRTLILAAETPELQNKWVKALTAAALMENTTMKQNCNEMGLLDLQPLYVNAPPKPRRTIGDLRFIYKGQNISLDPYIGRPFSVGKSFVKKAKDRQQSGNNLDSDVLASLKQRSLSTLNLHEGHYSEAEYAEKMRNSFIYLKDGYLRELKPNESVDLFYNNGAVPQSLSIANIAEKTEEELMLLLFELRRELVFISREIKHCYQQIYLTQKQVYNGEKSQIFNNGSNLEEKVLNLEKRKEKIQPILHLVENMVVLGSFEKNVQSSFNSPSINLRMPYNHNEVLLDIVSPNVLVYKPVEDLSAKVDALFELDNLLQKESLEVQNLQHSKKILENALSEVHNKLGRDITTILEEYGLDQNIKDKTILELELSKVHKMLADSAKKLEKTVAKNAKLESELILLRQNLQGKKEKYVNEQTCVPNNEKSESFENELTKVQNLVHNMQVQRNELNNAVDQLTFRSHTLYNHIQNSGAQQWKETSIDDSVSRSIEKGKNMKKPQEKPYLNNYPVTMRDDFEDTTSFMSIKKDSRSGKLNLKFSSIAANEIISGAVSSYNSLQNDSPLKTNDLPKRDEVIDVTKPVLKQHKKHINPPDLVQCTSTVEEKISELTINNLISTPKKIFIPERYVPEVTPELTDEEKLKRQHKVETIRKMLSEPLSGEKSNMEGERKYREHMLQLNQILAQQVTNITRNKEQPSSNSKSYENLSYDELSSPTEPLPTFQQRENYWN